MQSIGLYLHIPFCDGKCAYCNFFSKRPGIDQIDLYKKKLKDSIVLWGNKLDRRVDTVYFGGGTPSLLGHERLIDILQTVYDSFKVDADAEITVEVNPSSTVELDFEVMRKSGFNRLSIGLQSANDNELSILGRRHSVSDAEKTVKRAQKAGFDNISLDIMLAVPAQCVESLERTIDFCNSCGVQHISSYILKLEPGTPFWDKRESLDLFDDDGQAMLYEHAVKRLDELGYKQYEVSNFCKDGFASRHNLHYWHDEEYLGLGPSAHSFIDGKRFFYDSDFEKFYSDETVYESDGGDKDEYIMLALRLSEGLVFERFYERFHCSVSEKLIKAAINLEKNGLCVVNEKSISLTAKGFLVSNAVIGYLLENT